MADILEKHKRFVKLRATKFQMHNSNTQYTYVNSVTSPWVDLHAKESQFERRHIEENLLIVMEESDDPFFSQPVTEGTGAEAAGDGIDADSVAPKRVSRKATPKAHA